VPKLWTETIDAHRAALREAILDATAALVDENGLVALSMSQIADRAGIGRATLYKYFPDLQTVVGTWHERQITSHLQQLHRAVDQAATPAERLQAVLRAYAHIQHRSRGHHGSDVATALHDSAHVQQAARHLRTFLSELIADGVTAGDIRSDIPADDLAGFALHATTAAAGARSRQAVDNVVALTLAGLQPPV
jgi:AcrR family transcriptional regulator